MKVSWNQKIYINWLKYLKKFARKMTENSLGAEIRRVDELGPILSLLLKDKLFLSYNLHKRHVHAHSSKLQLWAAEINIICGLTSEIVFSRNNYNSRVS